MPDTRTITQRERAVRLVLSLCHEIGNLMSAVRLQVHLVDGDMSPRELARATLDVDDLCARSAALLAHVRPLLTGSTGRAETVSPGELVESVRSLLERHVPADVRLDVAVASELPDIEADRSLLHHLLQSLAFAAIEAVPDGGAIRLGAERRSPDTVAFVVEDDGRPEEHLEVDGPEANRGRPLLCAVARAMAAEQGGSCEVTRRDDRTGVSLVWPTRPPTA